MRTGCSRAHLDSVTNIRDLLIRVCKNPVTYIDDVELCAALLSQGKMASFSRHDLEIFGLSLNAQKRAASIRISGGFAELNQLRIMALDAIRRVEKTADSPKRRTVAGLKETAKTMECDLLSAREDCMQLSDAFYAAMSEVRLLLKENSIEDARNRWHKTERELLARRSLAKFYEAENSNSREEI